jgi:two-component system, NtrC family, sensor kinase
MERAPTEDVTVPTSPAVLEVPQLQDALGRLGIEPPVCRRVLLVDDEPDVLIVLEASLEDDWEIHTADNGPEALKLLDKLGGVDLVISDQRMPGMTGVDLLSEIAERAPETIRMVLTGYSDVGPIADAVNKGSAYRFLLKPWDIEELRAAVADGLKLKETRTTLNMIVEALAERRRSLRNTLLEMRRAQDHLVAAERIGTLGRLTSQIAHDIGNHLNAMISLVGAVQGRVSDREVLEAARLACRSVEDFHRLVKDVNSFARSRSFRPVRELVDTRAFIDDTLKFLSLEHPAAAPSVEVRVEPEGAIINIDPRGARQGLLTLLRNAATATVTGAPIRLWVHGIEDGCISVDVIDEGEGMSPEILEHAREPFFSAFEPKGLGMGLEIARLVAGAHDGSLDLESEPDGGTTARLILGGARMEGLS